MAGLCKAQIWNVTVRAPDGRLDTVAVEAPTAKEAIDYAEGWFNFTPARPVIKVDLLLDEYVYDGYYFVRPNAD